MLVCYYVVWGMPNRPLGRYRHKMRNNRTIEEQGKRGRLEMYS